MSDGRLCDTCTEMSLVRKEIRTGHATEFDLGAHNVLSDGRDGKNGDPAPITATWRSVLQPGGLERQDKIAAADQHRVTYSDDKLEKCIEKLARSTFRLEISLEFRSKASRG